MTKQEQDARRALKARRRELDRQAEAIAARGKRAWLAPKPSIRQKQARWHHDVVRYNGRLENEYRRLLDEMRELDVTLGRKNACTGGTGALV